MKFIDKLICEQVTQEFGKLCDDFIKKHDLTINELYVIFNVQNIVLDILAKKELSDSFQINKK